MGRIDASTSGWLLSPEALEPPAALDRQPVVPRRRARFRRTPGAEQLQLVVAAPQPIPITEWRPPRRRRRAPTSVRRPLAPTAPPPKLSLADEVAKWEAILASEGMPAELDQFKEIPKPEAKLENSLNRRRMALGDDKPPTPEEQHGWDVLLDQHRGQLRRVLRRKGVLTATQRLHVRLLLKGWRQTDIAVHRGVTDESVSISLSRARANIARALGLAEAR